MFCSDASNRIQAVTIDSFFNLSPRLIYFISCTVPSYISISVFFAKHPGTLGVGGVDIRIILIIDLFIITTGTKIATIIDTPNTANAVGADARPGPTTGTTKSAIATAIYTIIITEMIINIRIIKSIIIKNKDCIAI